MAILTFSFLIVHKEFQDNITYDVEDNIVFEDVLVHICDSFGFYRNRISVTSNLGMEIDDLKSVTGRIADTYGTYFKVVVSEPNQTFVRTVANQLGGLQTVEDAFENNRDRSLDGWEAQPTTQVDGGVKDILKELIEDMFRVHTDNWTVDPDGNIEIIIIPKIDIYINQLRVDIKAEASVKTLFTKVALTCGMQLRDVVVVPLMKEAFVIDDMDMKVIELVETHGAAFLLYPNKTRENLVSSSEILAKDVAEVLEKYG
ncbi:MAG: hypothetical protein ACXAE3_00835 [Candidatus Kariarchaeaceae archaeon]